MRFWIIIELASTSHKTKDFVNIYTSKDKYTYTHSCVYAFNILFIQSQLYIDFFKIKRFNLEVTSVVILPDNFVYKDQS